MDFLQVKKNAFKKYCNAIHITKIFNQLSKRVSLGGVSEKEKFTKSSLWKFYACGINEAFFSKTYSRQTIKLKYISLKIYAWCLWPSVTGMFY